ncbi:MAG: hypothetical protein U0521_24335 [Anaerolineae bacterium]
MNRFHNLFRFFVLVFVLASLILGPTVYSQEATPEIQPTEAIPTPVNSPTTQPSTETSPPTSEDTVVPTATQTATATVLEITAAPSPSQESFPTETQTEPATAIPTATSENPGSLLPSEPPLTQVFRDDFESGDDYAWLLGAGWSISPYADGSVLMAVGTVTPTRLLLAPLANVVITFRYQTDASVFAVHARANNGDGYALHVNPLGQIQLDRNGSIMA